MSSQRTYKKLGEFIEEYSVRNKSNAPIPVYSVTNDKGFCQGYFDKEVASKDKSTYKIVPRNFFAYNPSRINVGSIACQQAEDKVIVSPLYVIFGVNDKISCPYLLYFLKSPVANVYINAYARGAVRNNFSFAKMSEMMLPVPSVAEQEKIVKELDAIKEIIAAKYKQVDDLDNLAKALFYDIFGDPITNPKGWPVKKLGDTCKLKAGKGIKAAELRSFEPNLYPCYGGNGIRGYIDKYSHENDCPIIGRQGALCGNVNYAVAPFYATEHAVVVQPLIPMDNLWLYYLLKNLNLERLAHGMAQPGLSVQDITPLEFPLPPLDLQQSFAAKIQAIEAQKTTLRQSIAEFESLLAQRMDYHFN